MCTWREVGSDSLQGMSLKNQGEINIRPNAAESADMSIEFMKE